MAGTSPAMPQFNGEVQHETDIHMNMAC